MKRLWLFACCLSGWVSTMGQPGNGLIYPKAQWLDTEGQTINAHGGGVLYFEGTYYWFGEIKKGHTWRVPGVNSWEDYRVSAGGISCYSSQNLVDWKYEGVALEPNLTDSSSDLHLSKVIERPRVLYNERTRQFVMWIHVDNELYSYAHAGVAVSARPSGPYHYLGSLRPNGAESRDLTAFKDVDGKAYLVFSSEANSTMHVCLLSDDYLHPTNTCSRILVDAHREAPAMFRYYNKYYLITSLCTGWDPNQALLSVSEKPMGTWTVLGNPCHGPGSDSTFQGQGSYVFATEKEPRAFIFIADLWKKSDLADSRYIWLPIDLGGPSPEISWRASWSPAAVSSNK